MRVLTESVRAQHNSYGGSAFAFYKDPKMPSKSLTEWEDIHGRFYDKYRGLGKWQNDLFLQVCATGTYSAFTGRKWVFHKEPDWSGVLKFSKPAVCNYQVQGVSTGDIVPFAIMVMRRKILEKQLDAKFICQVHDSVVLDVAKKHVEEVANIVWSTFNELPQRIKSYWGYDFRTPLTGEIEVGENYKDLTKIYGKLGRL